MASLTHIPFPLGLKNLKKEIHKGSFGPFGDKSSGPSPLIARAVNSIRALTVSQGQSSWL